MSTDEILYSLADGVGTITLNRPQARNALTFAMYDRLVEICGNLAQHGAPKVLVITGAGDKAFAAGTDITQFRDFRTEQDVLGYESRIDDILSTIERCEVPTIAAISGAVTGGGAAIACCCDLRIATRSARFGFPIARTLGNCLSLNNLARLSTLFGAARVKELIFTARLVEADEGQQIGLYSEIVADRPALQARIGELAQLIAGHAPLTMRATKEGLRRLAATDHATQDSDLILSCYMSADFREGMEAFLAKRQPKWQGR